MRLKTLFFLFTFILYFLATNNSESESDLNDEQIIVAKRSRLLKIARPLNNLYHARQNKVPSLLELAALATARSGKKVYDLLKIPDLKDLSEPILKFWLFDNIEIIHGAVLKKPNLEFCLTGDFRTKGSIKDNNSIKPNNKVTLGYMASVCTLHINSCNVYLEMTYKSGTLISVYNSKTCEYICDLENSDEFSKENHRMIAMLPNSNIVLITDAQGNIFNSLHNANAFCQNIERPSKIGAWNVYTGEMLYVLKKNENSIFWGFLNKDIITYSEKDNLIQIWSSATGTLQLSLQDHRINNFNTEKDYVFLKILCCSDNIILTAFNNMITHKEVIISWDAITGQYLNAINNIKNFTAFIDCNLVMIHDSDHYIKIWNPRTGNINKLCSNNCWLRVQIFMSFYNNSFFVTEKPVDSDNCHIRRYAPKKNVLLPEEEVTLKDIKNIEDLVEAYNNRQKSNWPLLSGLKSLL